MQRHLQQDLSACSKFVAWSIWHEYRKFQLLQDQLQWQYSDSLQDQQKPYGLTGPQDDPRRDQSLHSKQTSYQTSINPIEEAGYQSTRDNSKSQHKLEYTPPSTTLKRIIKKVTLFYIYVKLQSNPQIWHSKCKGYWIWNTHINWMSNANSFLPFKNQSKLESEYPRNRKLKNYLKLHSPFELPTPKSCLMTHPLLVPITMTSFPAAMQVITPRPFAAYRSRRSTVNTCLPWSIYQSFLWRKNGQ